MNDLREGARLRLQRGDLLLLLCYLGASLGLRFEHLRCLLVQTLYFRPHYQQKQSSGLVRELCTDCCRYRNRQQFVAKETAPKRNDTKRGTDQTMKHDALRTRSASLSSGSVDRQGDHAYVNAHARVNGHGEIRRLTYA